MIKGWIDITHGVQAAAAGETAAVVEGGGCKTILGQLA